MHFQHERPLIQARHNGRRPTRQAVQQGAGFPIAEHTPLVALLVAGKNIGRARTTFRDQFQHPHFRRAKAGAERGEFFKQHHDGPPKPRQGAQIHRKKVDPGPRRRRAIGLPGPAGDFEMLIPYLDGRYPPCGHFRGRAVSDDSVGTKFSFETML